MPKTSRPDAAKGNVPLIPSSPIHFLLMKHLKRLIGK
jgi:hypothetical protein